MWNEPSLVTYDVLDVFGADMARLHDLLHRTYRGCRAEELDEEREANDLAMDGTGTCREQLE